MKVTKNTENTTYYGNDNTNNAVNIVNNPDKILRIKKIALEIKCIKSNDYSIIKLKISKEILEYDCVRIIFNANKLYSKMVFINFISTWM